MLKRVEFGSIHIFTIVIWNVLCLCYLVTFFLLWVSESWSGMHRHTIVLKYIVVLRVFKTQDVISRSVECYLWFIYAGGARFKLFPKQAGYKNTVHCHMLLHTVTEPRVLPHSAGFLILEFTTTYEYPFVNTNPIFVEFCWISSLMQLAKSVDWPPCKPHLSFQHQYQLTLCHTQTSVRWLSLLGWLIHSRLWDGLSHRCLAFNSSFLSVDGITCHISF
jgi:hypothetical protein